MFIVSLTYTAPLKAIDALVPEHIAFLDEQYRLGHFQLSGRKEPRTGGVIVATVKTRLALDIILKEDPFYRENLAEYSVIEMVPTMAAEPLQHLIKSAS